MLQCYNVFCPIQVKLSFPVVRTHSPNSHLYVEAIFQDYL